MVILNDLKWSMLPYNVIYLKISEKSYSKHMEATPSNFWNGCLIQRKKLPKQDLT